MSDHQNRELLARQHYIDQLERENAALREALEISDDYINQMLHGDIELTHGELEAWRNVIYPLRTKEAKP